MIMPDDLAGAGRGAPARIAHSDQEPERAKRMIRMAGKILSLALFMPLASVDTAGATSINAYAGWWVILANFPSCGSNACGSERNRRYVEQQAGKCGLRTFNDFSSKFSGFKGGYEVFVVTQPYSKAEAGRKLLQAKPCFPSAYVKYGRHMGE